MRFIIAAILSCLSVAALAQDSDRLGNGPHTLVITGLKGITRIDYKTGAACKKARDELRRQVRDEPLPSGVLYENRATKAYCVPR